jgi:hypothetical protein
LPRPPDRWLAAAPPLQPTQEGTMFRTAMLPTLVAQASLLALVAATPARAAEEPTRDNSYSVLLNQDSFFGFYPSFNGLLEINDGLDFSFYGILWTKPAFGLGQGNSGDDLWTEFGAGVNFRLMEGKLLVKPQLGITNGSLLSGGDINPDPATPDPDDTKVTGSNFADGIVPSLTVNYASEKFEAE